MNEIDVAIGASFNLDEVERDFPEYRYAIRIGLPVPCPVRDASHC